ncbi:MAG: hypothetical protein ABIB43_05760 [archaeon]
MKTPDKDARPVSSKLHIHGLNFIGESKSQYHDYVSYKTEDGIKLSIKSVIDDCERPEYLIMVKGKTLPHGNHFDTKEQAIDYIRTHTYEVITEAKQVSDSIDKRVEEDLRKQVTEISNSPFVKVAVKEYLKNEKPLSLLTEEEFQRQEIEEYTNHIQKCGGIRNYNYD